MRDYFVTNYYCRNKYISSVYHHLHRKLDPFVPKLMLSPISVPGALPISIFNHHWRSVMSGKDLKKGQIQNKQSERNLKLQ